MIFLSLGTHEQPFPRAIDMIRPIAETGEELVIQHGFTPADLSLPARWQEFVDHTEFLELLNRARAFVCHCGVGSVLTALQHGITPIVLPRERRFGEHLDDHQLDLAQRLGRQGLILSANPDIRTQAARAYESRGIARGPGKRLRAAVLAATEIEQGPA